MSGTNQSALPETVGGENSMTSNDSRTTDSDKVHFKNNNIVELCHMSDDTDEPSLLNMVVGKVKDKVFESEIRDSKESGGSEGRGTSLDEYLRSRRSGTVDHPLFKGLDIIADLNNELTPEQSIKLQEAVNLIVDPRKARFKRDVQRESTDSDDMADELIAILTTPVWSMSPLLETVEDVDKPDVPVLEYNLDHVFKENNEIPKILETAFNWDFDVLALERITFHRPLFYAGMHLMCAMNAPGVLKCDLPTLARWLTAIEFRYDWKVPYHNSTHAVDVMQACCSFLRNSKLNGVLSPMDEIEILIAAVGHDLGHPGKTNLFLSNTYNPLAILYNDNAILENYHAGLLFKLTLEHDNVNIFKNLTVDEFKKMRRGVIDMILATDMTKHYEHMVKFFTMYRQGSVIISNQNLNISQVSLSTVVTVPENLITLKRLLIKCADISNPTRKLTHSMEWGLRITEEYFRQTEEEKKMGFPVTMPMFERDTCLIPKAQITFIDYIVEEMMTTWDAFIEMPVILVNLEKTLLVWKLLSEKGVRRVDDIRRFLAKLQN